MRKLFPVPFRSRRFLYGGGGVGGKPLVGFLSILLFHCSLQTTTLLSQTLNINCSEPISGLQLSLLFVFESIPI